MTMSELHDFYSSSGYTGDVALNPGEGMKITVGSGRFLSSIAPRVTLDEEYGFHDSSETTAGSPPAQDGLPLYTSSRKFTASAPVAASIRRTPAETPLSEVITNKLCKVRAID